MKRFIAVPAQWVERSRTYGHQLAAHYAAGGSPRSRSRSGNRGTESNPTRLGQGKVGEVAVALYFGLDPEKAVKWAMYADQGDDVLLPCALLADVKTTFPHYNLIWSNNVNDLYMQKVFHIIIAVSTIENNWQHCWLDGFIDKMAFFAAKRIADGKGKPRLEPGTWWMPKAELDDVEELKIWKAQQRA
jgi:hypothetical protein